MQIILVHTRSGQAKNLRIDLRLVTIVVCLLVLAAVGAATALMLRFAAIGPDSLVGGERVLAPAYRVASAGVASAGVTNAGVANAGAANAAVAHTGAAHAGVARAGASVRVSGVPFAAPFATPFAAPFAAPFAPPAAPDGDLDGAPGDTGPGAGRLAAPGAAQGFASLPRSAWRALFSGAAPAPVATRPPPAATQLVDAARAADLALRRDTERVLRESIDALAVRVGQLQAELMRLDAIGQRVADMAGVDLAPVGRDAEGRGGPAPANSTPFSVEELSDTVSMIEGAIDRQAQTLGMIESLLLEQTVRSKLLPNEIPLERGFVGSGFGRRIDPFTGRASMHEGMDFNAPRGTPIIAAAAGVVVHAGRHPSYGNHVDIDHGDGLMTRYAHAARLYVKQGDIVKQGQRIAAVGSTGRSTGPHLHFEVLLDGRPQNPVKYLADGFQLKRGARLAAN